MTEPISEPEATSETVLDGDAVIARVEMNTPSLRGLADALAPPTKSGAVVRRWGIIDAINTNRTVNINLDGIIVPGVRRHVDYSPILGERVMIDVIDTDMIVVGAPSTPTVSSPKQATGDIEATFRNTPKPGAMFLQGQTLSRSAFIDLWTWITEQGLNGTVFGNGNGTTTFTLPDMRGRTPAGATTARPSGTAFGAVNSTLVIANLPAHDHGGSTDSRSTTHTHAFTTDYASTSHSHTLDVDGVGNHAHGSHGHEAAIPRSDGGSTDVGPRITFGASVAGGGAHGHSGVANVRDFGHDHSGATAASNASHAHSVSSQGSGTAFNTEDPGLSVNWMIWL